MDEEEREALDASVMPVQLGLTKVRFRILKEHELPSRMMPRDVTIRWNSTYDMLVCGSNYHTALNII